MQQIFSAQLSLRRYAGLFEGPLQLTIETEDGRRTKEIISRAAQESILGPDLSNISYNGLLHIDMPHNVFLVGYNSDLAGLISARTPQKAQLHLNLVMIKELVH